MMMLALCDAHGKVRVHVSEEDTGYENLIRELLKDVAGFSQPEEWFSTVAFPAFETNWTDSIGGHRQINSGPRSRQDGPVYD